MTGLSPERSLRREDARKNTDSRKYVHTDEEIRAAYADQIVLTQRLPEVLAHAMGDTLYLARFETKKEMDAFFRFATKEQ